MVSGVKTLGVTRSAGARAPISHPTTAKFRVGVDADERVPRWFFLIPLGPLVIIGLLVLSLWRMLPAPVPARGVFSLRADVEAPAQGPVADEVDATERMMDFGPVFLR